mgnify:FL=1
MKTNEFLNYEAPQVEVVEVEVEQGFAVSNPESMPYGNPW